MRLRSNILKIAVFFSGFSGIVAEYVLSTLASNFLGNSLIQWAMIISTMLFSMGLGSRLSKYISGNLFFKFILLEFTLSIFVSLSALISYSISPFVDFIGFVIYLQSIIIGVLIGLEIPLVVRLNNEFEELKVNISNVLEKDYYGSLLGGVFFSFVGLPFLGMTFTPIVLGISNFIVAILLLIFLKNSFKIPTNIKAYGMLSTLIIAGSLAFSENIILFSEQSKYQDKIIFSEQSKYQKIVITKWKYYYWLFINGNQQFSSYDEELYHEPIVHMPAYLVPKLKNVLILGGGDGLATRELLKYKSINNIKIVDLDPAMTNLGKNHPILLAMNDSSMHSDKVQIYNEDAFKFIENEANLYDLIIIDLPDPNSPDLARLYSKEFYYHCSKILAENGVVITQAGSPYYAPKAFLCIEKTMKSAGFQTLKMHNQILTLGQWGWVMGSKSLKSETMKARLESANFDRIEKKFLNKDSPKMLLNFGKNYYLKDTTIEINTLKSPVLYSYYLSGDWKLY